VPVLLTCLAIFVAKVAHVSLGTLRIIYLTRQQGKIAAAIGFFEAILYLSALGMVLTNLDQWINIFAYGLGFAAGNLAGSVIEEKIAVGFVNAQVITDHECAYLEETLREKGYGVTSTPCYGREGPHSTLQVLLKRRELPSFINTVRYHDTDAVISVFDTRKIMGGYFAGMKAK